jgi:hypothetical protein
MFFVLLSLNRLKASENPLFAKISRPFPPRPGKASTGFWEPMEKIKTLKKAKRLVSIAPSFVQIFMSPQIHLCFGIQHVSLPGP